jgi:hypothetical protein
LFGDLQELIVLNEFSSKYGDFCAFFPQKKNACVHFMGGFFCKHFSRRLFFRRRDAKFRQKKKKTLELSKLPYRSELGRVQPIRISRPMSLQFIGYRLKQMGGAKGRWWQNL